VVEPIRWEPRGLIWRPEHQRRWIASHGCTPTAFALDDERLRILFAPRDEAGRSIPTYIDADASDPARILAIGERPIMELGETGTFDDGGIMPCSIVRADGALYLYYVGWNASVSVPYRNAIGLAVSRDDGASFERLFPGAVVDRSRTEPFFTASPCVWREGYEWRMVYASTIRFINVGGRPEPIYVLMSASSQDGIVWERPGEPILPQHDREEAIARPTIWRGDDGFHLWFCYRGSRDFRDGADSYQIGYAFSPDGDTWQREDKKAGLPLPEPQAFDAQMRCYPNVIEHRGTLHMFYNGDGFGREGIGYAQGHR
jgi:predicted GH43/DUF377 family glycosyl hydrolase